MKLIQEILLQFVDCKKYTLTIRKNIVLEPHWYYHPNIQDIGIALSVSETIRNVFNGAETLEALCVATLVHLEI
jgi:hypothetical protein